VKRILRKLGFEAVTITKKENSDQIIKSWNFGPGTEHMVFSAYIRAWKPAGSPSEK